MAVLPLAFDIESPHWLKPLRWLAICGMTLTILGAHLLVGLKVQWGILAPLLAGLALWNFSLRWLEEIFHLESETYVFLQLLVDLAVLTLVLWFTGGLVNPFAAYYIFHVMIAGLLLTPRLTVATAVIAIGLLLILLAAPGMELAGTVIELDNPAFYYGVPLGLALLILLTTGFILAFLARLEHVQEESMHREKMAAVGRLVAGMAHELGTPLNVILLLARDLAQDASGSLRKDLETIAQQARRCGGLVSLLLGYSQKSPSKESTAIELVNARDWLREIKAEALAQEATDDKTVVDINVPAELERVWVPELVLRQVVLNLLRNAWQATRATAHPRIDMELRPAPTAEQLSLVVRDNGSGFSDHAKKQAFEAFFTTKEPGTGVGLGLYMSYYLMHQIGGQVRILPPVEAEGAIVEVVFPTAPSEG